MRKLALVLTLCLGIWELSAESKSIEFGLETMYSDIQVLKGNQREIPGWFLSQGFEEMQSTSYRNRESRPLIAASMHFDNSNEWNRSEGKLYIAKGQSDSPRLLLDRNAYTAFPLFSYMLGVGRRENRFHTSPFQGYADGTDGLFLEKSSARGLLQISLYDHYSGFQLFEKEIYRKATTTSEGFRRRHGIGYTTLGDFRFSIGWQIILPGSFGRLSQENTQKKTEQGGDGDFIHSANLGLQKDWKSFRVFGQFFYTKGRDRIEGKTLVIQGEAIQLGFEYQVKQYKLRWASHISDDDARKEGNQIEKVGHIGTGAHFGSTPFLSQILQVYPGSWFQSQGLERSPTWAKGRSYGVYSEVFFDTQFSVFHFQLFGGYYVPRKRTGDSEGRLSLKRENYEGLFLLETGFGLEWKESDSYQIGFLISQLNSDQISNLQGSFASFYGRVAL